MEILLPLAINTTRPVAEVGVAEYSTDLVPDLDLCACVCSSITLGAY